MSSGLKEQEYFFESKINLSKSSNLLKGYCNPTVINAPLVLRKQVKDYTSLSKAEVNKQSGRSVYRKDHLKIYFIKKKVFSMFFTELKIKIRGEYRNFIILY